MAAAVIGREKERVVEADFRDVTPTGEGKGRQ